MNQTDIRVFDAIMALDDDVWHKPKENQNICEF
jgi:hypothetical protein